MWTTTHEIWLRFLRPCNNSRTKEWWSILLKPKKELHNHLGWDSSIVLMVIESFPITKREKLKSTYLKISKRYVFVWRGLNKWYSKSNTSKLTEYKRLIQHGEVSLVAKCRLYSYLQVEIREEGVVKGSEWDSDCTGLFFNLHLLRLLPHTYSHLKGAMCSSATKTFAFMTIYAGNQ